MLDHLATDQEPAASPDEIAGGAGTWRHQRDATRIADGGQYELIIATDHRTPAAVAQVIIGHFTLVG